MRRKTTSETSRNLTLPIDFDNGRLTDLPIPEWVIECLGGAMSYIDPDDGSSRLYAVRDWVYWVSGSRPAKPINNSYSWSKLRKKLIEEQSQAKGFPYWKSLPIKTEGGMQTMDFADAEGLYQITIRMSDRSPVVREVKRFLARSGVIVDDIRLEQLVQGQEAQKVTGLNHSAIRTQSLQQESISHRHMMDALKAAVYFIMQGWHYEEAADTVLGALYNRRTNDLKAELGLKSLDRLQAHQPIVALSYQT